MVEAGSDLDVQVPGGLAQRLVEVQVVNRPLEGWRSRYLLRNVAAGCTVQVTFISRSDQSRISFPGRWSGQPEPWVYVSADHGFGVKAERRADESKVPQTRVIDISPGPAGQTVGIAVKTDGRASAYGFASESYFFHYLENPEWELRHEAYDVEVYAEAGGIRSQTAKFVLSNAGAAYTSMSLN